MIVGRARKVGRLVVLGKQAGRQMDNKAGKKVYGQQQVPWWRSVGRYDTVTSATTVRYHKFLDFWIFLLKVGLLLPDLDYYYFSFIHSFIHSLLRVYKVS